MANIFKQNLDVTQHPNRNNHDLTHKVHGTYKFGKLYPFLCKPVVPTDSFRIDTACGFQFMPMPFPTQSNIRCVFHYFYVRNKNLWENWENWLQGLEEHTPPYIDQPAEFYKTGSLADFLDIPTTLTGALSSLRTYDLGSFGHVRGAGSNIPLNNGWYYPGSNDSPSSVVVNGDDVTLASGGPLWCNIFSGNVKGLNLADFSENLEVMRFEYQTSVDISQNRFYGARFIVFGSSSALDDVLYESSELPVTFSSLYNQILYSSTALTIAGTRVDSTHYTLQITAPSSVKDNLQTMINQFSSIYDNVQIGVVFNSGALDSSFIYFSSGSLTLPVVESDEVVDLGDGGLPSPYYYSGNSDNSDTVKVSALPFRAYESIYRCYYANSVLQPLVVDGQKKYNRYNTSLGDGADTTDYHLFNRNWELDAYTSCLPSPQQGNAPLVGMNVLGEVTIQDPDTGAVTTAQTEIDGETVNLVVTSPIQSVEHARTLVNLSNAGISIADLRQTNNLTRFLEQSIRSGYRYVDFIKGQFGSEPKYAELDMPEFLGGFSQRVDVNTISNTNGDVPVDGDVKLGSYAGQARAFGGSKHGITRYFDDFGWIVGVMCIVPDAAYSQLLPKHFTFNNRLDYYFPVFSEIGLQPVTYEEVCPIQSHYQHVLGDENALLTDTFGYQRPNHDMVWYPDTVHGEMRLSLKDTLINRVFDRRPQLSDEFLTINPEETNNIFSVTEADGDVVIGQIVVKITAKRPVPRIVIPGLGR